MTKLVIRKLEIEEAYSQKQLVQGSRNNLSNLLEVSGFQLINSEKKLLYPVYIPIIGYFFNRVVANLPLLNRLCFVNFLVTQSIEQVTTIVEQMFPK